MQILRKCVPARDNSSGASPKEQGTPMLAYVDDFCGTHINKKHAQNGYETFITLCNDLGLQLAPEKCIHPIQEIKWLGYHINTQEMIVSIPANKLQETVEECNKWTSKERATKNELQQIMGKLAFISNCVTPGRKFLSRVLSLLRAAPDTGTIKVSTDCKADIRWFAKFAEQTNGQQLVKEKREELSLECDSCLHGGEDTQD